MNLQNNPYYQFVTCEEYKYVLCRIKMDSTKTYYDIVKKEENTTLGFPSFKTKDCALKLVPSMPDN